MKSSLLDVLPKKQHITKKTCSKKKNTCITTITNSKQQKTTAFRNFEKVQKYPQPVRLAIIFRANPS